eukprot:1418584-Rhodomonas_salina.1
MSVTFSGRMEGRRWQTDTATCSTKVISATQLRRHKAQQDSNNGAYPLIANICGVVGKAFIQPLQGQKMSKYRKRIDRHQDIVVCLEADFQEAREAS